MGRLRDLLKLDGRARCKGRCACGKRCKLDDDHSRTACTCGKVHRG